MDTRSGVSTVAAAYEYLFGIGWRDTVCAVTLSGMTEQTVQTRADTWEALLKAVRESAPNAEPAELKCLAEAYELLMRHA